MKCYRNEPGMTHAGAADNVPDNSATFKFKQKMTGTTGADGTKNVQIIVPLKCFSNF